MKSNKFIYSLLLVVLFFLFYAGTSRKNATLPKLVVGIVVDQMRYDYLTKFSDYFGENGFKRLIREGSSFTNAHFNYIPTYTAPGHASIYTGTTPYYHGIIANDWYDKYQHKFIYSCGDTSVKTVGADDDEGEMSPHRLIAKTVTDQLKIFSNGNSKVISISIKDRASVLPGGHGADAAYWYDANNGHFITSTFYMQKLPDWVNKFNELNLTGNYMAKSWQLSLPIEEYKNAFPDEAAGEKDIFNEGNTSFPHLFNHIENTDRYAKLRSTPYGNQLVVDFVKSALENEKLGNRGETDFLAISFSSTDYIGHYYGPTSVEIMDTYIKLDKQIEELLNYLNTKVGTNNYLLFLSSDHGVVETKEYLRQHNMPVGELGYKRSLDSLYAFAARCFGDKNIIEHFSNSQVYLNYDLIEKHNLEFSKVQSKIAEYLRTTFPEITRIFTREELETLNPSRDVNNFILNGFNPIRSGDIAFELRPGYMINFSSKNATSHATSYSYDTHVPIIFYGWHVPAQSSNEPVFTVDIAPTISSLLGITEPDCSIGKPLIK